METSIPQFKTIKEPSMKHVIKAPSDDSHLIPDAYKKVARDMETQFTEFMLEKMNKTDGKQNKSTAEKIYESYLTSERAQLMARQNDSSGIQKLILDQIYPKRMRTEEAYKYYNNQNSNNNRMIKMTPNSEDRVEPIRITDDNKQELKS